MWIDESCTIRPEGTFMKVSNNNFDIMLTLKTTFRFHKGNIKLWKTYISYEWAGNHCSIVTVYQMMTYWWKHADHWFLLRELWWEQAVNDRKSQMNILKPMQLYSYKCIEIIQFLYTYILTVIVELFTVKGSLYSTSFWISARLGDIMHRIKSRQIMKNFIYYNNKWVLHPLVSKSRPIMVFGGGTTCLADQWRTQQCLGKHVRKPSLYLLLHHILVYWRRNHCIWLTTLAVSY